MTDALKQQYKELSFLCLNYDPCQSTVEEKIGRLLEKYHLTHIEDPFMVTNQLLKMLDQCEGQIKQAEELQHNSTNPLH